MTCDYPIDRALFVEKTCLFSLSAHICLKPSVYVWRPLSVFPILIIVALQSLLRLGRKGLVTLFFGIKISWNFRLLKFSYKFYS